MSRENQIEPLLQELSELKDLLEVIRQTPSAPEVLYKLAGEKAQSLSDAVQAMYEAVVGYTAQPDSADTGEPDVSESESAAGSNPSSENEEESVPVDDWIDEECAISFELDLSSGESKEETAPDDSFVETESENEIQEDKTAVGEEQNRPDVVLYSEEADDTPAVHAESVKTAVAPVNPAAGSELSVEEIMQRKRARDIRKAMTLNDRFRFLRELFMNRDEMMSATIGALEKIETFADARIYLQEQFDWDSESEAVIDFMLLVEKHYL